MYEVSGNLNDAVDKAVEMARNDPENSIYDPIEDVKERKQTLVDRQGITGVRQIYAT